LFKKENLACKVSHFILNQKTVQPMIFSLHFQTMIMVLLLGRFLSFAKVGRYVLQIY